MAWQVVSEHLETPPRVPTEWAYKELRRASDAVNLTHLPDYLFRDEDAVKFEAQLDVIRHLMSILLHANDVDDEMLKKMLSIKQPKNETTQERPVIVFENTVLGRTLVKLKAKLRPYLPLW